MTLKPTFSFPNAVVPPKPLAIAALVSGGGTTLQNLINEIENGRLPATMTMVISSTPEALALKRARRAGVPTQVLQPSDYGNPRAYGEAIAKSFEAAGVELICMAGFLHFWHIPDPWLGRVLNIHPSLLPAFGGKGMYGDRVHAQVIACGCKVSGCTVHVADNEYDHGPIVSQRAVYVFEDDGVEALRTRVFHEECVAYPQAVRLIAEGRIRIDQGKVLMAPPLRLRQELVE